MVPPPHSPSGHFLASYKTLLVLPWWSSDLRLHASSAGGPGSIPDQGTRSHMPQLRACMAQLRPIAARLKHNNKITNLKKDPTSPAHISHIEMKEQFFFCPIRFCVNTSSLP